MVTGAGRADVGIVFALPVEAGRFADRVTDTRRIEASGLAVHVGRVDGRVVAWVVGGVGVERAGDVGLAAAAEFTLGAGAAPGAGNK